MQQKGALVMPKVITKRIVIGPPPCDAFSNARCDGLCNVICLPHIIKRHTLIITRDTHLASHIDVLSSHSDARLANFSTHLVRKGMFLKLLFNQSSLPKLCHNKPARIWTLQVMIDFLHNEKKHTKPQQFVFKLFFVLYVWSSFLKNVDFINFTT